MSIGLSLSIGSLCDFTALASVRILDDMKWCRVCTVCFRALVCKHATDLFMQANGATSPL